MKSVPIQVKNAIRQDYALYAVPRLIADWNFNRYFGPVPNNIPDEESSGFDVEYFPIESIILPNRPTKGIAKARVNASTVADDYKTNDTRFYTGDLEDVYKYWTSPQPTDSSGVFPLHTDGETVVRPHVKYNKVTKANKIVIKLENTWATPLSYEVKIQTIVDGTWSTISTTPTIRNDGQIIIYYNGTGWSSTKPSVLTNLTDVAGVMLKVNSLTGGIKNDGTAQTYNTFATPPVYTPTFDAQGNSTGVNYTAPGAYTTKTTDGKGAHLDLISIEAHREADLSDRLIHVSDTIDMGEESFIYPIGTVTTNTADIELSNEDGMFNQENPSSLYAGMLEQNVCFNLEYVYTVSGTQYSVQEFKMYSGPWQGQRSDTVTLSLEDASRFLQTTIPNPSMWEGLTVPQIMQRVLDSVGFVDYAIDASDKVTTHVIPVYWMDGEKSVWEELNDLALATQSAIYFDSFGILQIKTRETAFDNAATPDWTLRAETSGTELADIVSLDQSDEFGSNHVTVSYQTTKWSDFNNGQPTLQKVWEPDGTVALRASSLGGNGISASDMMMFIKTADVKLWPYKSKVNLEGEIIQYEGKQYIYYTGATGATRNVIIIKSQDELKQTDALTPSAYTYKNHFTGGLQITERGLWNSTAAAHSVDAYGYSVRRNMNGSRDTTATGFRHLKAWSRAEMSSTRLRDTSDVLVATRGAVADSQFYVYGTKFKFVSGAAWTDQSAGLLINNDSAEEGYYIDLRPSASLGPKLRAYTNELNVYSRVGGRMIKVAGKGVPIAIAANKDYEMDVFFKVSGSNHYLAIYLNGVKALNVTISGSNRNGPTGKFGMFIRGRTRAQFEYLYGINRIQDEPIDDVSFFDMVHDGYRGAMWDREWVYRWATRRRRVKKRWVTERYRYSQQYFDDFGPYLHEIREYDVKFDPKPVLHSRLFSTNDWDGVVLEYKSSPFGAKWAVANASRGDIILNGEDSASFEGSGSTVNQAMVVFGRALVINEAETVIAKNDAAIQMRGKIETDITSTWIQSKEMAQELADWISAHWSTGADQLTVEVFGNPLLEVTDVVGIEFARKNMTTATHKYFITGIETAFDNGVTTTLTLRRVI